MTKKQLEKYQKEFDEFVANVEKMGGRFLTEDELRYKINGGEGESSEDIDSAPTEATADGAGETQASNENEDSSGKSEETAEEDDDKSFLESVWETIVDFFTGGSKDDEKEEEESDGTDDKTETDKATSENKTSEGENKENSTKTEGAEGSADAASTANKNDSDLSTPERSDTSKSDDGGSWWSSFCDIVAGFVSAVADFLLDSYEDFKSGDGMASNNPISVIKTENFELSIKTESKRDTVMEKIVENNTADLPLCNSYDLQTEAYKATYDSSGNFLDSPTSLTISGKIFIK